MHRFITSQYNQLTAQYNLLKIVTFYAGTIDVLIILINFALIRAHKSLFAWEAHFLISSGQTKDNIPKMTPSERIPMMFYKAENSKCFAINSYLL